MRGQVATEFFIYSGIFLILVIAVASLVYFDQTAQLSSAEYNLAKENGQMFADALSMGVRGGPGFTYSMQYPQTVLGQSYAINFTGSSDSGFFLMTWYSPRGTFTYPYRMPTPDFTLDLCGGGSAIRSNVGLNNLSIVNTGQGIVLEQRCS